MARRAPQRRPRVRDDAGRKERARLRRRLPWWPLVVIGLVGAAAYANSLPARPLIFDDIATVSLNPAIRDLSNVRAVFSPPTEFPVAGRPLVSLSFAINYAIHGERTAGYHVVNLALHLVCALLLFILIRRTLSLPGMPPHLDAPRLALMAAMLWTVHPLNSEVVDYVSQRTESMMAAAMLFTLYAGVRAAASSRPARWMSAGVVACALGMTCKETMVVTPVIVVLYDRAFLAGSFREAWRRRWGYYIGLAATWLVLAGLLIQSGRETSNGFNTTITSPWTYLLNQTVMILHYLRLAVWPDALVLNFGWVRPLTLAASWPSMVAVTALVAASLFCLVRYPRLGFLCASFFVLLAPTSSIVPIAAEVGAERRMYLPLAVFITLVVIAGDAVWQRLARRWDSSAPARRAAGVIALMVVAAVMLVLAGRTLLRNREYESGLTMARTVVARWPSPVGHQLLGIELSNAGQYDEGIAELREAARGTAPAYFHLGLALYGAGQTDQAVEALETFVREEPRLSEVTSARTLLARLFELKGDWRRAQEQEEQLLALTPGNDEMRLHLARALLSQRQYLEAIPHYRSFLTAHPESLVAWSDLGIALIATNQNAAAVDAFRKAASLDPTNAGLRSNLARAMVAAGQVPPDMR